MTNERWEKAKAIFIDAIKLAPELRIQYLNEVCGDDTELRREVESLLTSHLDAEGFMETPAVGEVADVIHRTDHPFKGRSFNHYEIIEKIGAGGMGEVYLAEDKKLDRKVAVKILNERFARHESNLNRFTREAKTASALSHPNILVVHEIGVHETTHYIVSEFIKGKTLGTILRERSLKLPEVLSISIQIAGALCAAHEERLVHRDIKPENVMLRADGIVKVLDFGLAKLVGPEAGGPDQNQTAKGVILGTVNYMSPEQARGEKVDSRTDIFSFGCVLYEMLTGQLPFRGETLNHTIVAILEKEPPPISLFLKDYPAEIERIVKKCLEKSSKDRYGSAKDLLADLKSLEKRLDFEKGLELTPAPDTVTLAQTQAFELAATVETPGFVPPNNLSENPEPIVGREKEIAEIKNLLRQTNVRLVTLTGIGGAGKTRLALAVARDLLFDFPDGVFFVELAAVTGADLVPSAVAQPLDVKEAGGKPVLETLKDNLRDKKMLLVIDNFEQVAAAAPQIGELLHAPRLKIIITSRTLLRLSAEYEFVVPPLAVPSELRGVTPETLADYDAVKLFVQKAQKAKHAFVLTEENAASVAEICIRLDGLPLAIELAAARVKIFTPSSILSKLGNRLRLLTGGARDLPAHQQTMRATVEWSYGLLNDEEKSLFRQLAVFSGGFTFEAAEAVCRSGPDKPQRDFLDLLTSLVEKSLLVTKEPVDGGETRFRLLEVVREYALEILEASGEADDLRRRHFEYFLALGEEAETQLLDVSGAEWLNRLEDDHENLRSALEWSSERKTVEAARLAGAIRNFWSLHCHYTEARQWSTKLLERGASEIPVSVRFKLLNGLGSYTRVQGDNAAAEKFYEQGLFEGKAANDLRQIAHSNRGLGLVSFQRGDLTATRKFMEESLRISRELDDRFGIALTLTSLGDLERAEGNTAAARPLFEESMALCRQLSNKGALGSNLSNLGAISFDEGNFEDSYFYFAECLANAQEMEDKSQISLCLDGFAALAVKRGEYSLAARLAGAAEHLREQIGYEIEPSERRFREAFLSELRSEMEEPDFSKFYEQGRKMKLEEMPALAQKSQP